jgi:hypothetical protein
VDAVEGAVEISGGGEVVADQIGEAVVEEEEEEVGALYAPGADNVYRALSQRCKVVPRPDPLAYWFQGSCTGRRYPWCW